MSTERKYSVKEIDGLRRACETKYLYGSYNGAGPSGGWSRSFREDEKTKCVEEMVRTHMLAGHIDNDLYASEMRASSPPGDQRTPE